MQVPFEAKLLGLAKSIPAGEDPAAVLPELSRMVMEAKVADRAALLDVIEKAGSVGAGGTGGSSSS